MIGWYDKDGTPLPSDTIEEMQALEKKLADRDYKRVGYTEVGPYFVSTVWLGLDQNMGRTGVPLIFETMVFERELSSSEEVKVGEKITLPAMEYHKSLDDYFSRYPTLEFAKEGHERIVKEVEKHIKHIKEGEGEENATTN